MHFSCTNNRLHRSYFVNIYNAKHRSVKEKYLEKDRSVFTLLCLIEGGLNKMHQGVHYQGFFPKIFNTQQLDTKEYSQYQSVNPCYQNVQSKVRLGLSLPRMNVLFIPQQQDYNLTCFLYLNQSLQTVYHVSVSISFMGPKIWELLSQTF